MLWVIKSYGSSRAEQERRVSVPMGRQSARQWARFENRVARLIDERGPRESWGPTVWFHQRDVRLSLGRREGGRSVVEGFGHVADDQHVQVIL